MSNFITIDDKDVYSMQAYGGFYELSLTWCNSLLNNLAILSLGGDKVLESYIYSVTMQ